MSQSLLIIGSGGQGKMALDCAVELGIYGRIAFYTNDVDCPKQIAGYEVIQERAQRACDLISRFDDVFIAIGDNGSRERLTCRYESMGANISSLVHPRSYVSSFACIGKGSIVMPHASVNAFASVGVGCIINTNAVVEHDCHLDSFVHVSPLASMGGGVTVGERSWLCIGSCVKDHISIAADVTVGANSCVLRDIDAPGVYLGSPAKPYCPA